MHKCPRCLSANTQQYHELRNCQECHYVFVPNLPNPYSVFVVSQDEQKTETAK